LLSSNPSPAYDELISYAEHINRSNGGTSCALFVIQNDQVVAEHYRGVAGSRPTEADSQYNVASVRKSYLGLAAAWALHDGAIRSFDDPILDYISIDQDDRAALQGVTIRHLLTHTHGITLGINGRLARIFDPGLAWDYNNLGIDLLCDLLMQATGSSIAEVLESRVFQPLGWKETSWRTSPSEKLVPVIGDHGSAIVLDPRKDGSGGNLFVSARELAYWGYLHLKLGRVNGKTIVPEQVVRTAISVQTPAGLPAMYPRNGCLWLVKQGEAAECLIGQDVPKDSYKIVGIYGPLVLVVPELDLVVVRMANRVGNYGDAKGTYIDYLKEFSSKAVGCAKSVFA